MRLLLGLLSSAVVASSTCAQCDHGECTLGFCVCDDGWAGLGSEERFVALLRYNTIFPPVNRLQSAAMPFLFQR